MRPLGGYFLLFSVCLTGAGCAYGATPEGFGGSPIDSSDGGSDPDSALPFDSATPGDSATPEDSTTPDDSATPIDSGTPDTSEPLDTSRPLDTGSTCSLELPTGIAACDTCVGMNCCSADNTCGSDPACMSFVECIDTCEEGSFDGGLVEAGPDGGVEACVTTCETEYPTGATELEALDSCLEGACASACEGP